jgi:hypothetical protein
MRGDLINFDGQKFRLDFFIINKGIFSDIGNIESLRFGFDKFLFFF